MAGTGSVSMQPWGCKGLGFFVFSQRIHGASLKREAISEN